MEVSLRKMIVNDLQEDFLEHKVLSIWDSPELLETHKSQPDTGPIFQYGP